jgi:cytochrome c oxidase subunit 3
MRRLRVATKAPSQNTVAPPPPTTHFQGEVEHGHDHDDHHVLQHHFDDMDQQRESISLGMWTFLMTEIMMFSGLFFCYALFRWKFYDAYLLGSQQLNITLGTINTFVLLASSMTMALAVHAAQTRDRKRLVAYIIGTIVFGGAFLGVKAVEWTADYHEGLVPKISWDPTRWPTVHHPPAEYKAMAQAVTSDAATVPDFKHFKDGRPQEVSVQQVKMYFLLYFCMTGLHAIHMVAGILILIPMLLMAMAGSFTNGNDQPIEIFGLYWHFIDIVWVFLFPLLYLIAGFHMFSGGSH